MCEVRKGRNSPMLALSSPICLFQEAPMAACVNVGLSACVVFPSACLPWIAQMVSRAPPDLVTIMHSYYLPFGYKGSNLLYTLPCCQLRWGERWAHCRSVCFAIRICSC